MGGQSFEEVAVIEDAIVSYDEEGRSNFCKLEQ